MTTARDIMHPGIETVTDTETLALAARLMRDLDIGALPVCDSQGTPVGIVTDRDIVVKCLAEGQDPTSTTAGALAQGKLITVPPERDIDEVLAIMELNQIRRLPVLADGRLVGIITESDIARGMPESAIGEFVGSVCAP
ncbi:CBS domain-containing protein [Nocardia crassostreae]|uniref:CBS domain-containing protein n=1 Tax=Nocardia crassostreae TaxID=53428 RepID=UPI0008309BED|nr:CBS domain-containing protein [Nocardia crassostreae]